MRKKVILVVIIIVILILLVPIPFHLKDGGTVEYKALMYEVAKVNRLNTQYTEEYNYSKEIKDIIIKLKIPNTWKYEEILQDDDNDIYEFALKLYKNESDKNIILYYYKDPFVVCGTNRRNENIKLNNGENANIGYYNDLYEGKEWSDISFYEINTNIAFINNGIKSEDAEEFLDIVKTISIIALEDEL